MHAQDMPGSSGKVKGLFDSDLPNLLTVYDYY